MVALAQGTWWDPDVLARIRVLELRARDLVQGYLHGAHLSGRATSNVEFADYKEYSPGDPLRDLDWRVMGRSDRLVVRRHHAENELATTIILDASGDMATGAAGDQPSAARPPLKGSKWGSAAVLCATLAYWLQRHGEPVGLMVLGGQDVRWPYLPPRNGEAQLARILGVIAQTRPSGRADLSAGLRAAGQRMGRRQLMVLVSDLMEEPAEWGPAVSTLLRRRIDLRVDVSIYRKKIEIPIVVGIKKARAPTQVFHARCRQTATGRCIDKVHLAIIPIQRIGLTVKIGDKNIAIAIAVVVADIHSHAVFGFAVEIKSHTRQHADIAKKTIPFVLPQHIGPLVIGDKEIQVAVEIEVLRYHAQAVIVVGHRDTRLLRHIDKVSSFFVAVEPVGSTGQTDRPAKDAQSPQINARVLHLGIF